MKHSAADIGGIGRRSSFGSDPMSPNPASRSNVTSLALGRLRRAVLVCSWALAIAIVAQVLTWCVATFMDVRFDALDEKTESPKIVKTAEIHKKADIKIKKAGEKPQETAAVDPNRVLSKFDSILSKTTTIAFGVGSIAIVLLIPMIGLGVLIGAGSATRGVEITISAFIWSLVLALLVLPVSKLVGLPWEEGALVSYGYMTQQVDQAVVGFESSLGQITFYARFAVLPLACLAGVALIGLRFCEGVDAGIFPKENVRLDPKLEKEAGNIAPSSLHGGRAGAALRAASAAVSKQEEFVTPISQTSPGDMPKRLI